MGKPKGNTEYSDMWVPTVIVTRAGLIYLVGVMLFGFAYHWLRDWLSNDVIFLGVAIIYLLLLRGVARKIGGRRTAKNDPPKSHGDS